MAAVNSWRETTGSYQVLCPAGMYICGLTLDGPAVGVVGILCRDYVSGGMYSVMTPGYVPKTLTLTYVAPVGGANLALTATPAVGTQFAYAFRAVPGPGEPPNDALTVLPTDW
jgi:hypothetical protein